MESRSTTSSWPNASEVRRKSISKLTSPSVADAGGVDAGPSVRSCARAAARAGREQPSAPRPGADADAPRRPPGPRVPPARLGGHPPPAHRHLRVRRQAGGHGLGERGDLRVFAPPAAARLYGVTRPPPVPGGKGMVYGAGALGTCATAILRALHPDVEVLVVARFEAQAALARKLGASVIGHEPAHAVIEESASWSGGVLQPSDGLPMAYPGEIDVVYDTIGKQETFEVGARVLKARGTLVKAGVHGPTFWEDTPLYFKEISMVGSNAFGFEEVEGMRNYGIGHYPDIASADRIDLTSMLTHT